MYRKLGWIVRIIYNFIRMPLLWAINFGKVKYSLIEFISPKTIIRVGRGGSLKLGKKCMLDGGTLIRSSGGKISIGNCVYINRNCNIVSRDSIVISDGVTIGPNVCIYDHDHTFGKNKTSNFKVSPIEIGENVWIGANVVILRGTKIGSNSVIGAGTIIRGNIPMKKIITQDNILKVKDIL